MSSTPGNAWILPMSEILAEDGINHGISSNLLFHAPIHAPIETNIQHYGTLLEKEFVWWPVPVIVVLRSSPSFSSRWRLR